VAALYVDIVSTTIYMYSVSVVCAFGNGVGDLEDIDHYFLVRFIAC
jgi:hypothetical protein